MKPAPVKSTLAPKLRFPEFRDGEGWITRPLGEVAKPITEKVGETRCIPMSITSGVGLISQMEKFGRVIAGNSYKNYLLLKKNDFAYNKSATKDYPEGYIALYGGDDLAAVPNSIFTCFRIAKDSLDPKYLNNLFFKNLHGQWLRKFIEVGARAHGSLSISDDDLFALPIPIPGGNSSGIEQRKIAACLSSLDDLIGSESRKLDALKAHKKGLMQQLFPREGEAVPRLRFPEFRNAPKWKVKKLGDLCDVLNGLRQPIASGLRKAGPYPYYGASGIVDYVDNYIFREPLLLIGEDGAKWGAFEKTAFIVKGKYWVNNHAHVLRIVEANDTFVENHLNFKDLTPFVTGAAPPKLTLGKMKSIPISLPPIRTEQDCIATCLSSCDNLIAIHADKIEALKTHKNGLMQQLFPSTKTVEA